MLKVLQVSVGRSVWRGLCFFGRRVPAAGRAGSLPGSEAAASRGLSRRLCSRYGGAGRTCTVDPNQEEQFVFLDCTGETPRLMTGSKVVTNTRKLQDFSHFVFNSGH